MKISRFTLLLAVVLIVGVASVQAADKLRYDVPASLQKSKLFVTLDPALVATPDGMVIAPDGDLVVACPNFGNLDLPGRVIRIDKYGKVSKWFDVPVNKSSGVARPMGIEFDDRGNLYIVDNQGWTGKPECINQGRILKIQFDKDGNIAKSTEIVTGMEHPNGVKYRDGYLYVTQSSLSQVKDPSGKLVSCVYRFPADARDITVSNTLADKYIIATFITENLDIQYGVDGLVFDKKGNLYVGNFGDGSINKLTFNSDGSLRDNYVWARDNDQLMTTDGMCIAPDGSIYVADFSPNAIAKVSPKGIITRIAQSPDSNGSKGELDQPGEPIFWNGKLVITCFDMVTDDGKVNSQHEAPHTIVTLDIAG
ncbi:MAG: phage head-tail adapter protein [Planctomycetota bacterium]|jgi:sugar lactone lactonase YvrE|nr:phage head-tail adapter protein [Planctomycetota bacterium]